MPQSAHPHVFLYCRIQGRALDCTYPEVLRELLLCSSVLLHNSTGRYFLRSVLSLRHEPEQHLSDNFSWCPWSASAWSQKREPSDALPVHLSKSSRYPHGIPCSASHLLHPARSCEGCRNVRYDGEDDPSLGPVFRSQAAHHLLRNGSVFRYPVRRIPEGSWCHA